MQTNQKQWLKTQFPKNWSANVAVDVLCKIKEKDLILLALSVASIEPLETEQIKGDE